MYAIFRKDTKHPYVMAHLRVDPMSRNAGLLVSEKWWELSQKGTVGVSIEYADRLPWDKAPRVEDYESA